MIFAILLHVLDLINFELSVMAGRMLFILMGTLLRFESSVGQAERGKSVINSRVIYEV